MHDDDDDDRSDDRLIWWDATLPALECIIDCLDLETRQRVTDRLRLAAVTLQDKGLRGASYYLRSLSGEPSPGPGPIPRLSLDAELEKRLTKDFDFRSHLQPQQGAAEEPRGILWTLAMAPKGTPKPPQDDNA
jgi:hypothetical protein